MTSCCSLVRQVSKYSVLRVVAFGASANACFLLSREALVSIAVFRVPRLALNLIRVMLLGAAAAKV